MSGDGFASGNMPEAEKRSVKENGPGTPAWREQIGSRQPWLAGSENVR
jgi:hypothetical protein